MNGSVDDSKRPVMVWFRNDLRLTDNPALVAAAGSGGPLVALYVLDKTGPLRPLGAASSWWLHHSLTMLEHDLCSHGVPLIRMIGAAKDMVPRALAAVKAREIHWNRRYEPAARTVDDALKTRLEGEGVHVASHNGALLVEPWTVKTKGGGWFKVFTPFWKASQPQLAHLRPILPVPTLTPSPTPTIGVPLTALKLKPNIDWASGLREMWMPGETSACARLNDFLDDRLAGYVDGRNFPGRQTSSKLSPHLRFGEISAPTLYRASAIRGMVESTLATAVAKFQAELGWRDFSYNLLFHFPDLAWRNIQQKFDGFSWRDEAAAGDDLAAWRHGRTGYPIVDAGMRQLWRTGTMHNRVRMIAASFLVKHLLIDWRLGEAWFWNTLCDADPANNPANWQWVAGCGADAAPYFRIFNPVLQGERFDAGGDYVRQHVPELASLPPRLIHKPWTASAQTLHRFGVSLGQTYPRPIVDHTAARIRALAAFARLKSQAA